MKTTVNITARAAAALIVLVFPGCELVDQLINKQEPVIENPAVVPQEM